MDVPRCKFLRAAHRRRAHRAAERRRGRATTCLGTTCNLRRAGNLGKSGLLTSIEVGRPFVLLYVCQRYFAQSPRATLSPICDDVKNIQYAVPHEAGFRMLAAARSSRNIWPIALLASGASAEPAPCCTETQACLSTLLSSRRRDKSCRCGSPGMRSARLHHELRRPGSHRWR